MSAPLLAIRDLVREYALPRAHLLAPARRLRVLHGVSVTLEAGRSLGVVGESGSGKSTLARAALALEKPQGGSVRLLGEDPFALDAPALRRLRRHMQAIFQDPYGSLDPRHNVMRIVSEPIASLEPETPKSDRAARVIEALGAVGLHEEAAQRYPHEFSGGQRQRIAIARALVTRPDLIVADEAVSALDVSVQAQVLNLMMDLQETMGLSYLFISHDLGVVRTITDDVVVMYQGRIVEEGATDRVFDAPAHPYTQALVAAIPKPGVARNPSVAMPKGAPETVVPTAGCPYSPRCPLAQPVCRQEEPAPRPAPHGGRAACHFVRGS